MTYLLVFHFVFLICLLTWNTLSSPTSEESYGELYRVIQRHKKLGEIRRNTYLLPKFIEVEHENAIEIYHDRHPHHHHRSLEEEDSEEPEDTTEKEVNTTQSTLSKNESLAMVQSMVKAIQNVMKQIPLTNITIVTKTPVTPATPAHNTSKYNSLLDSIYKKVEETAVEIVTTKSINGINETVHMNGIITGTKSSNETKNSTEIFRDNLSTNTTLKNEEKPATHNNTGIHGIPIEGRSEPFGPTDDSMHKHHRSHHFDREEEIHPPVKPKVVIPYDDLRVNPGHNNHQQRSGPNPSSSESPALNHRLIHNTGPQIHAHNSFNNNSMILKLNFKIVPSRRDVQTTPQKPEDSHTLQTSSTYNPITKKQQFIEVADHVKPRDEEKENAQHPPTQYHHHHTNLGYQTTTQQPIHTKSTHQTTKHIHSEEQHNTLTQETKQHTQSQEQTKPSPEHQTTESIHPQEKHVHSQNHTKHIHTPNNTHHMNTQNHTKQIQSQNQTSDGTINHQIFTQTPSYPSLLGIAITARGAEPTSQPKVTEEPKNPTPSLSPLIVEALSYIERGVDIPDDLKRLIASKNRQDLPPEKKAYYDEPEMSTTKRSTPRPYFREDVYYNEPEKSTTKRSTLRPYFREDVYYNEPEKSTTKRATLRPYFREDVYYNELENSTTKRSTLRPYLQTSPRGRGSYSTIPISKTRPPTEDNDKKLNSNKGDESLPLNPYWKTPPKGIFLTFQNLNKNRHQKNPTRRDPTTQKTRVTQSNDITTPMEKRNKINTNGRINQNLVPTKKTTSNPLNNDNDAEIPNVNPYWINPQNRFADKLKPPIESIKPEIGVPENLDNTLIAPSEETKPKKVSGIRKCSGQNKPVVIDVVQHSNFIPKTDTRFMHFSNTLEFDEKKGP